MNNCIFVPQYKRYTDQELIDKGFKDFPTYEDAVQAERQRPGYNSMSRQLLHDFYHKNNGDFCIIHKKYIDQNTDLFNGCGTLDSEHRMNEAASKS